MLLTSPDMHHDVRHTFVVSSVGVDSNSLISEEPVPSYFRHGTIESDPDFAVEVARLRRSVVIEAEEDDMIENGDGLLGGHLIVYHTPQIQQRIQGVEFVNMGQQGALGRYPVHFHMSGDCTGSVVSKNVIRQSNQRCVVIHGTHNVLVEDNVSFETHRHRYFTEDGIETGNTFARNLGASILAPNILIPGENDNAPAVFWVTNPSNHWIDNVAAGSDSSGFWFDTRPNVRGPSLSGNEIVRPQAMDLLTFRGNTAHSSNTHGMQYYSPGYQPSTEQVMDDSRVYRNRWGGHFVHGNRHLTLTGGYAADNGHGLRTFRDGNIIVRDKRIIGTSQNFLNVLAETKRWWYCPSATGTGIDAVTVHPWRNFGTDVQYDVKMENITFSRFGPSTGCPSTTALVVVDPSQTEKKRYTSTHYFADLIVEDEEPLNRISGCWATDNDVYGMAIEDSDGSLAGPTNGGGAPGFFVDGPSDASVYPFANAGGTCSPANGAAADLCLSYCPEVCLYTLTVRANNAPTLSDLVMSVADTSGTGIVATDTWHKFVFNNGDDHMTRASFDGYFGAAVPASSSGTFDISFADADGQPAWPDYVEYYLEKQPECASGQLLPAINLVQPARTSARCDELVKNGNFEDGNFNGWQQGSAHLALSSPGAGSSLHQLYVTQRSNANEYASQWLDVSCLQAGVAYGLSAFIKMEQNNVFTTCSTAGDCPRAKVDMYDWDPILQRRTLMGSVIVASAAGAEVSADGYYLMEGNFVVSHDLSLANSAQLIFDQPANVNYYLDDVSISALPPTLAPTQAPTVSPSDSPTDSPVEATPATTSTYPDPYPGVTEKFILPYPTSLSGSSYAFDSPTWHYSHLLPPGVTLANVGQHLHTNQWAAAHSTPQFIKYEYDSSVGFNTLYFAQRGGGCDMVSSIKVYAFDSDPGDTITMSSSNLGEPVYELVDEKEGGRLKTRDNRLEEYFLNSKVIMGKYIVFETYGYTCWPGGRALLLGYQPDVTYFPTQAPTSIGDVINPFVLRNPEEVDGSQYQHNDHFSPSKLVDGSFSLADLGTSANQGNEWAAQRLKQVVVYRYDGVVNFNTIYYAQRSATCDKMERIKVWVFNDDPGASTSIKSQGLQEPPGRHPRQSPWHGQWRH